MYNLTFSCSSTAFTRLLDLSPHKQRSKSKSQFTGTSYAIIPASPKSAKGLSNWLLDFLFRPSNSFDTTNYALTIPHAILPQTFTDKRPTDQSQLDYEMYGEPGKPLLLTEYNYSSIRSRRNPTYTTWSDGSDVTSHSLNVATNIPQLLVVTTSIVQYWHISTAGGTFPLTPNEEFSAFMNALGMGYLSHPILEPKTASISSNSYYTEMDKKLAKMQKAKIDAVNKTRLTRPAYAPNQSRKRVPKCQTLFDIVDGIGGVPGQTRCPRPAEYTVTFLPYAKYNLCLHCYVDRTKWLEPHQYTATTYVAPESKSGTHPTHAVAPTIEPLPEGKSYHLVVRPTVTHSEESTSNE